MLFLQIRSKVIRCMLFWQTHSKAIIWALATVIVLVAVILFVTRENLEIAPELRIHHDIDDLVVMNIRNISNGIIEVYITNDSNAYLEFGFLSFSIEHFDSSYLRILPLRRDAVFLLITFFIAPNSSTTGGVCFTYFYHRPKHGGLYRIRLETSVRYYAFGPPTRPVIIHDIVAEFIYGEFYF